MLFALMIFALVVIQTYLIYVPPNGRGNAINEKWRMYRTAKKDPIFDHNCKFFLLSNSLRLNTENENASDESLGNDAVSATASV